MQGLDPALGAGGGPQKLIHWNTRSLPGNFDYYYVDYDDYEPSPGMPFKCTVAAIGGDAQQLNIVTSVMLYGSHLNGNMSSSVVELVQLDTLELQENSVYSVADLPPSLTSLNLRDNSLERLPPLGQLPHLTALDVSKSFIKQEFPRCITDLPLRSLQISVRRGRHAGRGLGVGGKELTSAGRFPRLPEQSDYGPADGLGRLEPPHLPQRELQRSPSAAAQLGAAVAACVLGREATGNHNAASVGWPAPGTRCEYPAEGAAGPDARHTHRRRSRYWQRISTSSIRSQNRSAPFQGSSSCTRAEAWLSVRARALTRAGPGAAGTFRSIRCRRSRKAPSAPRRS